MPKDTYPRPFEKMLAECQDNTPEPLLVAMTWVNDTLRYARASAEQIFGADVTADHVFEVYDRMVERLVVVEAERSEK